MRFATPLLQTEKGIGRLAEQRLIHKTGAKLLHLMLLPLQTTRFDSFVPPFTNTWSVQ